MFCDMSNIVVFALKNETMGYYEMFLFLTPDSGEINKFIPQSRCIYWVFQWVHIEFNEQLTI